ncbi:MAG: hypothetical protein WCP15_01105 [bacterium]
MSLNTVSTVQGDGKFLFVEPHPDLLRTVLGWSEEDEEDGSATNKGEEEDEPVKCSGCNQRRPSGEMTPLGNQFICRDTFEYCEETWLARTSGRRPRRMAGDGATFGNNGIMRRCP